jgi:hypothetical protein
MNNSFLKNNLSNISKHFNELLNDISSLVRFSELFYLFDDFVVDISLFLSDADHFEYDRIDRNQVHHDEMMRSSTFIIVQDILSEDCCFFL